jgi:hypothetical protein
LRKEWSEARNRELRAFLWLAKVAEMAAGCCFDETQREVMQDELYRAMHATDVRMVKVDKLAEQLDAAYPSSCSTSTRR